MRVPRLVVLLALLGAGVVGSLAEEPKASTSAVAGYPEGADVAVLSKAGEKVGPLAEHRVKDKYTVFDVYADWCGPCKVVDHHLREVMARRHDVAIRKLNVVDEETPLALELGDSVHALPHVEVYTPKGRRIVVEGIDDDALDEALKAP